MCTIQKIFSITSDVATTLGVIIAVITVVFVWREYNRQNKIKKVDNFFLLRKGLADDPIVGEINDLLENDDPKLGKISYEKKRRYLGAYEEIALANNWGLINDEVALYMFGYYPIQCENSKFFWTNVKHNSRYWKVFVDFARKMEKHQNTSFKIPPKL